MVEIAVGIQLFNIEHYQEIFDMLEVMEVLV